MHTKVDHKIENLELLGSVHWWEIGVVGVKS